MRHLLASIAQRLRLPIVCALCNQYHRGNLAICAGCHQHLLPVGHACYHCALPLPNSTFSICGHCIKQKPYVDEAIAAYRFEEPLRTLLHEFKYREGLYLSSFLASLMLSAQRSSTLSTECLIPVPMHPKRLRQRGFNQAAELTKHLAKALNIPYGLAHCTKHINTLPQAKLNAHLRQQNLRNAFQTKPLPFKHITLIDDLITTGSTVNELAKSFKEQGVLRVDVWACARAT